MFLNWPLGGRIDQAHHSNLGQKALADTLAFDDAISKAMEKVNLHETLIIVSADHSHTFSVSGYALFEENILGESFEQLSTIIKYSFACLTGFGDSEQSYIQDGKPVLQMGYINGPGALDHRYKKEGEKLIETLRKDLTESKGESRCMCFKNSIFFIIPSNYIGSEMYDKEFKQDSGVWSLSESHAGDKQNLNTSFFIHTNKNLHIYFFFSKNFFEH